MVVKAPLERHKSRPMGRQTVRAKDRRTGRQSKM